MSGDTGGFDERAQGAHQKMLGLVGKNKRILEVGCGSGFVSERLQRNGCAVTAIELDRKSAERAKRFCEKVLVRDVEKMGLGLKPNSFDAILFGDVLEHLQNPAKVLVGLKRFLRPSGRIVVSIPNLANWKIRLGLLFGKFDYADEGILDKTHLHFFTRKTARELLEGCGYEIVQSDFVPSFPFPFFKSVFARLNPNAFAFQFIFAARKK